jgi:hypothetical protein
MQIDIDIEDFESLITFDYTQNPSGEILWQGKANEKGTVLLSFIEKENYISNVKFDATKITTNKDVLYARLNNSLFEYRQSQNDGFEVAGEDDRTDNDVIEDPYNPDDIKVRKDLYSITDIFSKINKKDIDLNPDFQRHLVWNKTQKSRLIESILLGIPLPVFYFAEDKDGAFSVVDGLQRLSTIRDFLQNKFDLTNLQHLSRYCNKRYFGIVEDINERVALKVKDDKALERRFQRRIENTQLNINIIEASSPAKVKYDIFNRINEGGKPLNKQEIRNSLAKNHTRELLQTLAKSEEFINATKDISDIRMGAQELVLRFIGFYLSLKKKVPHLKYQGDMNDFLDKTNEIVNTLKDKDLQELKKVFLKSMRNAYHLFGKYCFRKYLPEQLNDINGRQQLLNKALFVTWSVSLSDYETDTLVQKIDFEQFAPVLAEEFRTNEDYFKGITNKSSDRLVIEKSFVFAENLLKNNLH